MENCLFCKMAKGEIPVSKIYEDDKVLAFFDIEPQAPVHFLVIPKEHYDSIMDASEKNEEIISYIFKVIAQIAKEKGFDEKGFRVVTNINEDGGQSVKHLHYHVLAGRSLTWPPG